MALEPFRENSFERYLRTVIHPLHQKYRHFDLAGLIPFVALLVFGQSLPVVVVGLLAWGWLVLVTIWLQSANCHYRRAKYEHAEQMEQNRLDREAAVRTRYPNSPVVDPTRRGYPS